MKFVFRMTADGRTFVVRRGFDRVPTRAEVDALIDEMFAEANFVPPKRKAKK